MNGGLSQQDVEWHLDIFCLRFCPAEAAGVLGSKDQGAGELLSAPNVVFP
jgi:hypothetical protein